MPPPNHHKQGAKLMLTLRQRGTKKIWYYRGTVRAGERVQDVPETSTGTENRRRAEQIAREHEAALWREMTSAVPAAKPKATFAHAARAYRAMPGQRHPIDQLRLSKLEQALGDAMIEDVPARWLDHLAARREAAPATLDRERSIIQAALNYYGEALGVSVPKLRKIKFKNQIVRFLTTEEQERLLASYNIAAQPIALFLCFQGCRTQECLQLDWSHISLERETVRFERTKSGEPRTVPLAPRVLDRLTAIWEARGRPTSGHVFLNMRGQPYADTRDYGLPGGNPLKKAHATACQRAGIHNFRVHDWRHHWASQCMMKGLTLESVRKMGGWASLEMLQRYASVSTEHLHEQIRKLV
jgi:integrase